MSMHCNVCGTDNPDGTTYCDGCGVELGAAASTTGQEASPPSTPLPQDSFPETFPQETLPDTFPSQEEATQFPDVPELPSEPVPPIPSFPDTSSTSGKASLTLKVSGALTSEIFQLLGERHTVGKFDPSLGPIEIDLGTTRGSEYVSRRHAEVYRESGRWMIRDLGSTNGIFIRRAGESSFSARLVEPAPLHHGDEVALGNLILAFLEQ